MDIGVDPVVELKSKWWSAYFQALERVSDSKIASDVADGAVLRHVALFRQIEPEKNKEDTAI